MTIVHRPGERPVKIDGDTWTTEQGALVIHKGTLPVATFADGTWTYIEVTQD